MKGHIERGFLRFDNGTCACLDCLLSVEKIDNNIKVGYWYKPINEGKKEVKTCIDYEYKLYNDLIKWIGEGY